MAGRIDAEYQQLKDRTHRWAVERLDEEGIEVSNANRELLSEFIRTAVNQHIALNRVPLSTQDLNQLVKDTLDEVLGFGPLEPLLADPRINDILVNGPDSVFIEVAGVVQPNAAPRLSRTPSRVKGPPAESGAHTEED